MSIISYRSNSTGTLQAAYIGTVRVGYVENRMPSVPSSQWLWQLILLRPGGTAYVGKENTEGEAKETLETSVHHWLECAGLKEK